MENEDTVTVTVRMRQALRDELEKLAEADHRPLANYLRVVLEKHVEGLAESQTEEATAR